MQHLKLANEATIEGLRERGLSALAIVCKAANCNHVGWVHFDRLDFHENTPISSVVSRSRFRCERCCGRDVSVGDDGPRRASRK